MRRPFRRYCFHLAKTLGMTVKTLLNEMDSREITEWMAYDTTCNEEWKKNYDKEQELAKSREMSDSERLAAFKAMLGGNKG